MLKESENPPITWPDKASIRDFDGLWWVAHTRSRNEKALAQDLISRDISYFLPMSWKIRSIRGRRIKSLLPLFSGYVFFCGDEKQRIELLKTNRVVNLIEVKDQEGLIGELSEIERALRIGAELQPHRYIKTGQRCRVKAGPLRDLEGIILKTKTVSRLILQVDMLGQAASVEMDYDLVEMIE